MYSYTGLRGQITGALLCAGLVACGGGGEGGGGAGSEPSASANPDMTVEVMGIGASGMAKYQLKEIGNSYSITKPPTQGSASVSATGLVTYTPRPSHFPTGATDTIGITIIDGGVSTTTTTLTVKLQYDPLLPFQWHIQNTGQSAFSSTSGSADNDVNAAGAWAEGITGKGVLVNVVDTGLEIGHEDLKAQVLPGGSYNFLDGTNDPTATQADAKNGDHGTSVAGIIAATAFNGVGGRGIAYGAKLIGFNFISSTQTLEMLGISFGGDTKKGSASVTDIFNASYGSQTCTWKSPETTVDGIYQSTTHLRSGKGALVIKSAGNGFTSCGSTAPTTCVGSGISCDNANSDAKSTNYNLVVVSALNASGVKSSYSSTGSNIWVTGIGGEYGYDVSSAPGYVTDAYKPAIVTTDVSGCGAGYDNKQTTPFHIKGTDTQKTYNPACNYTSTFNGTSSAAPTVSGVVALMLDARPDLTYRDVKYLLATTARPVDTSKAAVTALFAGNSAFPLEAAWTTNAAGRNFHNWYGFGLVDARAAVTAAKDHILLGTVSESTLSSSSTETTISYGTTPTEFTFTQDNGKTVEEVIVNLTVDTSNFKTYCAHIELLSPSGTKSILMNGYAGAKLQPTGNVVRLLSNAFYGESSAGTWTMNIYNGCNGVSMKLASTVPTLTIRGH